MKAIDWRQEYWDTEERARRLERKYNKERKKVVRLTEENARLCNRIGRAEMQIDDKDRLIEALLDRHEADARET